MRIALLLFGICIFSVSATVYSQEAKISIQLHDKSVNDVLSAIKAQSSYSFWFDVKDVDLEQRVTINMKNASVKSVLTQSLKNQNVEFSIHGNHIIIAPKGSLNTTREQQQGIAITGTVIDETNSSMPGVNVIIKGTTTGIVTDQHGKYSITVPDNNAILVFSFMGYTSQEIQVGNQLQIDVNLAEDTKMIDEVIIVGYGSQKKETLTGSIVAIKGDEIVKSPSANLVNSLAGRLPGVIINSRNGEPGREDVSINIRGRGTTGKSDALIIIDGVERGGMGELNPNDIESISVLKDASAAIYGSRAANGVILITTKRGSQMKPTINISFNQGLSQPTRNPRMADSYTFNTVLNEIEVGEGRAPRYTNDELQKFKDGSDPNYQNNDWYKYMIKKVTPQHRTNVSVSGGNERVKYFLSFGELYQSGQYKNGSREYRQYNLRSNVDVQITDNLKVGMNLSGRYDKKHYPYWNSSELNSHMFLYQPDWKIHWPGTDYRTPLRDSENILNWVGDDAGTTDESTRAAQTTIFFKWDLPWVEGLSIDGSGSYDPGVVFTKTFQTPTYVYYKDEVTGAYNKGPSGKGPNLANLKDKSYITTQFYLNAKINYVKRFDLHNIGIMAGYEQTKIKNNTLGASRSDFLTTSIPELNLGSSDKNKQGNEGSAGQDARQNYFGRVNYDYAGKYLAEFTMRVDGSPKFPKEKRYGYFPSGSVGWRISEESFMKSLVFINNLKVRGSFGIMGNDRVNDFQYLMTYGFRDNYVVGGNDVSGLVQTNAPNPYITWETAKTWNIGFDASLWNGLLSVEFDYFNSRRSDILTIRSTVIPDYTGLKLPDENIGIVDNKGFELILSHANTVNDFYYKFSGNVSFARNKVVYCDEQPAAEDYQRKTGRPDGVPLLYNAIGIFRDQQHIDAYPHLLGARPGDIIYEDVNGDQEINSLDQVRGNQTNMPEIVFGLSAYVKYKGFDLSVLFQGQENAKQHFGSWFPMMSHSFGNFLDWRATDRWSPENMDASMPRGSYEVTNNNTLNSTQWLLKSGFLRLKNLEFGYNLPASVCERLKIQGLRLSVGGNNLFIVYDHMKDLGFDPETKDFWYYQQQRVFNFGVNLTF